MFIPSVNELQSRTEAVLKSIYLLFNEGYNSTNSEELIRKDLMDEAMLLCKLLTENSHTQQPESFALMALMCFHNERVQTELRAEFFNATNTHIFGGPNTGVTARDFERVAPQQINLPRNIQIALKLLW